MGRNIEYLKENGPSSFDELPNYQVTVYDRRNGVWKLKLGGLRNTGSERQASRLKVIYYMPEYHNKEKVIEKWIKINKETLSSWDNKEIRTILRRLGHNWYDAIDNTVPK